MSLLTALFVSLGSMFGTQPVRHSNAPYFHKTVREIKTTKLVFTHERRADGTVQIDWHREAR